jgi:DNA-binding Xre family transcriptional regulator
MCSRVIIKTEVLQKKEAKLSKLIIKQVASARNMKQTQLHIKAGVTPQLLYRYWHNFTQSVELEQLEKIARALEVEPGDLIVSDKNYRAMTDPIEEVA